MPHTSDGTPAPADGAAYYSRFMLRLYISGPTTISSRALVNIRTLCEKHLRGNYDLEVVDLSLDPKKAQEDRIISLPTLMKLEPLPVKRFVGDMSNTDRILACLGIDPITIVH